jgi:hypothetical protein
LLFEGRLVKNDDAGTAYADEDIVTLTNNAMMYLYHNIRYTINDKQVESVYNPGRVSTVLGLLRYRDDICKSKGLNQCWVLDSSSVAADTNTGFKDRYTYVMTNSTPRGTLSFVVSLSHILNFCTDYQKVIYGCKHTLELVRKQNSNEAVFHPASVDAGATAALNGKVNLTKVQWFMPQVSPSLAYKNDLKLSQVKRHFKLHTERMCVSKLRSQQRVLQQGLDLLQLCFKLIDSTIN